MTPSETNGTLGGRPEAISPLSPVSSHIGHSRTISMSSDRPSVTGSTFSGILSMPTSITPEPNYIATSAASQIVTNDHDSQSDTWFDQHGIEPSGETAMVASAAMKSVNRFLDQLLFQFLATAKSVSLASLRPAVIEVLKPKLAKAAIAGADQELNEYLGGGEDEELLVFHNNLEPPGQWDLELVWKRTRLRCMVYSSFGDMEEEDEDRYTEEGGLEIPTNRFSSSSGVVSPAVAIFLTSILEYMGEKALIIAGQAAYQRLRAKHEKDESEGTSMVGEIADRVEVTEMDMERVALDGTLGRLWRGWKKRIRSPSQSVSMGRSFSRESLRSRAHSRKGSSGEPTVPPVGELPRKSSVTESMIHENAASIALPMGDDDIREIEIPGIALHSDDEDDSESDTEVSKSKPRPKSMVFHQKDIAFRTSDVAEQLSPVFLAAAGRKRSNSLPIPIPSTFHARRKHPVVEQLDVSPINDVPTEDIVSATTIVPIFDETVLSGSNPEEFETEVLPFEHDDTEYKEVAPFQPEHIETEVLPFEHNNTENKEVSDSNPEEFEEEDLSFDHDDTEYKEVAPFQPDHIETEVLPFEYDNTENKEVSGSNPEEFEEDDLSFDHDDTEYKEVAPFQPEHIVHKGDAPVENKITEVQNVAPIEPVTTVEETDEHVKTTQSPTADNNGVLARVIAGTAAMGVAAIADITAAAMGHAPTQYHDEGDSGSETEQAQILTSSRVSIGGRASPVEPPISSKAPIVRPQSVHSLRVVDIPPPSPALSRAGSVHSPVENGRTRSPVQRTATASPAARAASVFSQQSKISGSGTPETEKYEETSHPRVPAAMASPQVIAVPDRSPLREHVVPVQAVRSSRSGSFDEKPVMSANTPYFGEPQFVLAPAPTSRGTKNREANVVNVNAGPTSTPLRTPDSGAPPLTPLRELMEVAPDTSDEASSIAPSVDTNEGHPATPVAVHRSFEGRRSPEQSKAFVNGSSPQRLKHTTRTSPSQIRRDDDITPKPQSFTRSDRQLHTSGSSTSSGSHKIRPFRTSEDSHQNGSGKSFEELIQSDQTIQYTLTSQNMRQIESPTSPRQDMLPSSNGHRPHSRNHSNKSNKSVTRTTGLHSNPPPEVRSPAVPKKPYQAVQSQVVANSGSRVRPNAPQARDARIDRESNISDFADFIRSTGPPGVTLPPSTVGNRGSVRNAAARVTSLPVVAEPRSSNSSTVRRLQAREAVIPLVDNTSDLIDFIRQGPPSEKTHDNPRIPRTVAPFRTTMDSDQMSGAVGGRSTPLASPGVRDSVASGSITNENSMQSMHSSVNSQSALLNSYKVAAPKSAPQKTSMFDEEDQMPKRKQRRVRDPYAIDFSDEDEDEFEAAPVRKPQRKEESLIEFLSSVPPPAAATSSVFDSVPKPVSKKASAPSLMSRFRHGSTEASSKPVRRESSSNSNRVNGHASQGPPPHIPIAVTIPGSISSTNGNAKYNGAPRPSDRDNYSSRLDNGSASRSRVQQKQFQPRDPTMRASRFGASSELADFLMNTPPPPGNGVNQPNFSAPIDDEDKAGSTSFRNMFGRRKKAVA